MRYCFTFAKNSIWLLGIPVLAFLLAPLSTHASMLTFQERVVSARVGDMLTMPVSIEAGNDKNYTARLVLAFPLEILEVVSFAFASQWISIQQSNYDLMDNARGQLIKTAGYPGGFSGVMPFGVITFRAKKPGRDIAIVGGDSFILNGKSVNVLDARPQIVVHVSEKDMPHILPSVTPIDNLPAESPNFFDAEPQPIPEAEHPSVAWVVSIILLILAMLLIIWLELQKYWHRWVKPK